MTKRQTLLAVAGAVLLVVLTFLGAAVAWRWAGGPREDFASWISAMATFAALIAASIAAVFAIGAFRLESKRERRWEESQRRAQADLVGGWCHSAISYGHRSGGDVALMADATVSLRNASPLPVFQLVVKLTAFLPKGENTTGAWPTEHPDGDDDVFELVTRQIRTLPPGSDPDVHEINLPVLVTLTNQLMADNSFRRYAVALSYEFSDASGYRWARDSSGRLRDLGLGVLP